MELSAYLNSKAESANAFAVRIGTSRQNVSRWCAGVIPRRRDMLKIIAATDGNVMPNDFALNERPIAKPSQERAA